MPQGFALFFHNFSTFEGKPGLYLEDLFVRPEARGSGLGKALLAHLAKLCAARDCARLEWSVLDWNAPSIGFYKGLGARMMDEWTVMRVDGAALAHLAGGRSEEHTSELQSLMRISYAVFCLKKKRRGHRQDNWNIYRK